MPFARRHRRHRRRHRRQASSNPRASLVLAQGLRQLAVLQHILHGVPLLLGSYLLHSSGAGGGWEELALGVLLVSVAALVFGLPLLIVEFSQPRNMVPESLEAGVTYYSRRGSVSTGVS